MVSLSRTQARNRRVTLFPALVLAINPRERIGERGLAGSGHVLEGECHASRATPDAGEPRLLLERQAVRPVVMLELDESRLRHHAPPCLEIVVGAVAAAVPSFLVGAARIGAEQHATRL